MSRAQSMESKGHKLATVGDRFNQRRKNAFIVHQNSMSTYSQGTAKQISTHHQGIRCCIRKKPLCISMGVLVVILYTLYAAPFFFRQYSVLAQLSAVIQDAENSVAEMPVNDSFRSITFSQSLFDNLAVDERDVFAGENDQDTRDNIMAFSSAVPELSSRSSLRLIEMSNTSKRIRIKIKGTTQSTVSSNLTTDEAVTTTSVYPPFYGYYDIRIKPEFYPPDSVSKENLTKSRRLPLKPLCPLCSLVVDIAPAVDLTYIHVAGNFSEHPHQGARDINDTSFGYIHDETALRRNPPKLRVSDWQKRSLCTQRDYTHKMIKEKIRVAEVGVQAHTTMENGHNVTAPEFNEQFSHASRLSTDLSRLNFTKSLSLSSPVLQPPSATQPTASSFSPPSATQPVKLFCFLYTTAEKGHSKIQRIRETWGPKCDGFMAASTVTDPSVNAVNIVHEGPEDYYNMWQKVRSMWSYVYDHYYDKYDWFHIGGDDLFLIVENLRMYLGSEEIRTAANGGKYLPDGTETAQVPLYLGCRHKLGGNTTNMFNSGGSGYTLNKASLKLLVVHGLPNFFTENKTSAEDVVMSYVFRKMGILPYETKDETGGERYNVLTPGRHYSYRPPTTERGHSWFTRFIVDAKLGLDHCAEYSTTFHYVAHNEMHRLHLLLYGLCPDESISVARAPLHVKKESQHLSWPFVNTSSRLQLFKGKTPSKPLCDFCRKVVEAANPISLTYFDVARSKLERSHLGAKDEHNILGYVHNTSALRFNPPVSMHSVSQLELDKACRIRDGTYNMIRGQIRVASINDLKLSRTWLAAKVGSASARRQRILCIVHTTDSHHATRIQAIRETWGPKCDGFMVASNSTNMKYNAVNILYYGPRTQKNLWQKVRSIWRYVYDNYYDEFDWFHLERDDGLLIVENLRLYLESEEIRTASNGGVYLPNGNESMQFPLFLGCRHKRQGGLNEVFNAGPGGYTLNKGALKALAVYGLPQYFGEQVTNEEDVLTSSTFRNLGVNPYETKDSNGGERYNVMTPGAHLAWRPPRPGTDIKDWFVHYIINPKTGFEHCSKHSITFHNLEGLDLYRTFALLYGKCPLGSYD